MAKFGVLKKITALATAIALVVCFAVSASAISVRTTTTYDNEVDGEVEVTVTVTGTAVELPVGANVTYYATKGGADVHIDQTKVLTAGTATFAFNTVESNLKSNALVGYTGATEANDDSTITGYTVTYPGGSAILPEAGGKVEFNWSADSGYVYDGVTITGATATDSYDNGKVTLIFGALAQDVTVAVKKTGDTGAVTAAAEFVDAGALLVDADFVSEKIYDEEGNEIDGAAANPEAEGDRKLTVMGRVSSAKTFGIVISETVEFTDATYTAAQWAALENVDKFAAAADPDATGIFAVQLIDTSDNDAWVKANTTYNTGVYVEDENGCFKVYAGTAVTTD